ncbi:MAG: fumarate hydratase [candidate division WOR-3 bacterium]
MREIPYDQLVNVIAEMCPEACMTLDDEMKGVLQRAMEQEESPLGKRILGRFIENLGLAEREGLPFCEDTGQAVLFVDVGEEVRVSGKGLTAAINDGVRKGYGENPLRKSVVDPITRRNTWDNTPAIIHYTISPGDKLRILLLAKGGGSENMSVLKMFPPSAGWEGMRAFIIETIAQAGGNPCPPTIVGIGIGGDFELAALNAKRAFAFRKMGQRNPDPFWAEKELEILEEANKLGIGPQGLGGTVTVLDVFIEVSPCHIASLPLAINFQCPANRRAFREV